MKILLIHNYYQNSGGEDVVVANERSLLIEHEHDVKLYSDNNDRIVSPVDKLKTATSLSFSGKTYKDLTNVVKEFQPDIIHAHNLFPLITAAAYEVAIENSVPIVQTMHNYRAICSSGLLLRDNKPCELCIKHSPYHAVIHKCYRKSLFGSLALAYMINGHNSRNTWAKVDCFIALTEFAKSKLIEIGIPAEKTVIKPNYSEFNPTPTKNEILDTVLFVGRVSSEKGIETLIDAWQQDKSGKLPTLRIIGDGPLLEKIKTSSATQQNIEVLGHQPEAIVKQEMSMARCLVFPSVCYEGFPMVIVEALANGLPVICSNLGSMTSIIEHNVTGLFFEPNNSKDLVKKIYQLIENSNLEAKIRQNCRNTFLEKYTAEKNYEKLMSIYSTAIGNYKIK